MSQSALTFLGAQPMVNADRLGIHGTSYGGATVIWTAAVDPRVQVVVYVVGIGHGTRWMRSVRYSDEYTDLAAARRGKSAAVDQIPLEYIDDTLGFNPE